MYLNASIVYVFDIIQYLQNQFNQSIGKYYFKILIHWYDNLQFS